MKSNLRETLSAPVLSEAKDTSGAAWIGIILGTLAASLYSLKAIFVKLAYLPTDGLEGALPPITLMMLRLGFSFPVYLLILVWVWRKTEVKPTARQIILAMLTGILAYYLCTLLDFTGLQYITAQLERLILFTYPAFVVIFGALFFGGRLTPMGLVAVALAYSGLAVVFLGGDITESSNLWLGSGLILATAICFSFFQLFAKEFIARIGPTLFTCLAMIGAAVAPRIYVLGLTIAVFSTLLPSFFMNIAIGRIGAQKVAMLGMIGPLATIIAAVWILGEPFGVWDGVGTALTMAGIALYMKFSKDKPRKT